MCDDSARQSWGRGRHHRYVESWILLFYCFTTTIAFHRTAPRYCELSIVSGGGGSWFVADSIWWILTRHCVALHCTAQYVNGIKWSVQYISSMCVCVCWQSRRTIRTVNVNRNKSKKGDERADRWEMGGAGQGKTKGGERGMKDMALQVQWVEMLKVNVFFFSLSLSLQSDGRLVEWNWNGGINLCKVPMAAAAAEMLTFDLFEIICCPF